eukprot:2903971-Prorocentrum_lima.AAC.1
MEMPRVDHKACVSERAPQDGTKHANELERWVAIFISQKGAVKDFGQTAPDKKLWERMTVLDLHTR